MSDRIGFDPIAMILGPIKSDPYNINDIISDRIKSDIDDIGSDQINAAPAETTEIGPQSNPGHPAASLDHDPGLAADAVVGDGVGGCPHPRGGFGPRGA